MVRAEDAAMARAARNRRAPSTPASKKSPQQQSRPLSPVTVPHDLVEQAIVRAQSRRRSASPAPTRRRPAAAAPPPPPVLESETEEEEEEEETFYVEPLKAAARKVSPRKPQPRATSASSPKEAAKKKASPVKTEKRRSGASKGLRFSLLRGAVTACFLVLVVVGISYVLAMRKSFPVGMAGLTFHAERVSVGELLSSKDIPQQEKDLVLALTQELPVLDPSKTVLEVWEKYEMEREKTTLLTICVGALLGFVVGGFMR